MGIIRGNFRTLLHLVDEADLKNLDQAGIKKYAVEWMDLWEDKDNQILNLFTTREELTSAIEDLQSHLPEHKLLFGKKKILAFIENGRLEPGLSDEIHSIMDQLGNSWLRDLFIKTFNTNIREKMLKFVISIFKFF